MDMEEESAIIKKPYFVFGYGLLAFAIILVISISFVNSINVKGIKVMLCGGYGFENMPCTFVVTPQNELMVYAGAMSVNSQYEPFSLESYCDDRTTATVKLSLKDRFEISKLIDEIKMNGKINNAYANSDDGIVAHVLIDGIWYSSEYQIPFGGKAILNEEVEQLTKKIVEISPIDIFKVRE